MGDKHQYVREQAAGDHAAFHAWLHCSPESSAPSSVEFLTRGKGRPLNSKSRIYRLRGVRKRQESLIAKLGPSNTIETERIVYQEILPSIGIPFLKCYGTAPGPDGKAWLFLEEAQGVRYEGDCASHKTIATEILARIHTVTSEMSLKDRLPKHDLERYERCLKMAVSLIEENWENPALSRQDRKILKSILKLLGRVEESWIGLGEALGTMPQCLVHGDFIGKNARVHTPNNGEALMYLMDWELSGWGAPAYDLDNIVPEIYRKSTAARWPNMMQSDIEFMGVFGKILRNVGLIQATSSSLRWEWVTEAMGDLAIYEEGLSGAMDVLIFR